MRTFVCTLMKSGADAHGGTRTIIGVVGLFEAVYVWKLDGYEVILETWQRHMDEVKTRVNMVFPYI